jgi:hypothetical protein
MFSLSFQSTVESSLKVLKTLNILDYMKGDHHGKSSQKESIRKYQGSKRIPDRLHWFSLGYQESQEGKKQKEEKIIFFLYVRPFLSYTDPNKQTTL